MLLLNLTKLAASLVLVSQYRSRTQNIVLNDEQLWCNRNTDQIRFFCYIFIKTRNTFCFPYEDL